MPTPVTIVTSGGLPVTNVAGGSPFTVVTTAGIPVTLVDSGGSPVSLLNEDGTAWSYYYIDSAAANDLGDGKTALTAKKSWAGLAALGAVLTNATIRVAAGSVWRGESFAMAYPGMRLLATGAGAMPTLIGSTLVTGTWTTGGSNIWSVALAVTPSNVFLRTAYTLEGFTKLVQNTGTPTTPSAGQWGFSAATLYVFSVTDPNTLTYERVLLDASVALIELNADNCTVDGLAMIAGPRNGTMMGLTTNGCTVRNCDVGWNTNDNCDGQTGTNPPKNAVIEYCRIWGAGLLPVKDGSGASGDGISFHGGGSTDYFSVIIRYNDIRYNQKSGIGNQSSGFTTAYGNLLDDNWDDLAIYGIAYTRGDAVHRFFYNQCTHPAGNSRGFSITGSASINSALRLEIDNNVFYGALTSGKAGIFVTNNALITMHIENNIVKNWSRGIDDSFNLTNIESLDYNCLHGNTTNYYDNSTGLLNAKVGAHSLTSDPLFTSAGTVFTLAAGSPCKNAGHNLGYIADKAGNLVPFGAAPDIGCFERQS